jgi:hypothetical protein
MHLCCRNKMYNEKYVDFQIITLTILEDPLNIETISGTRFIVGATLEVCGQFSCSWVINHTRIVLAYGICRGEKRMAVILGCLDSSCPAFADRHIETVISINYRALNMEPAKTACCSSSQWTTRKWHSHNAEHSCHMFVGEFQVMWNSLHV